MLCYWGLNTGTHTGRDFFFFLQVKIKAETVKKEVEGAEIKDEGSTPYVKSTKLLASVLPYTVENY